MRCPGCGPCLTKGLGAGTGVGVARLHNSLTTFHGLRLDVILGTVGARGDQGPIAALQRGVPCLAPKVGDLTTRGVPMILFNIALGQSSREVNITACTKLILLDVNGLVSCTRTTTVQSQTTKFPRALTSFMKSDKQDIGVIIPFALSSNSLPGARERVHLFRARTYLHTKHCCRTRLRLPIR